MIKSYAAPGAHHETHRRFSPTKFVTCERKKVENHAHVLAIYFMHYNFADPPLAGYGRRVTDKLMEPGGVVEVLGAWEVAA